MKVDDCDIDFDTCDACRSKFCRSRPPMVIAVGLEQNKRELVMALCASCLQKVSKGNRDIAEKAEATARLRPGRLRARS